MMLRNPFTKWLWDSRRSLTAWAIAIAVVGGGYAALWPTIADPDLQEALDSYPDSLLEAMNYDDISTPAGYLTATVYGLLGPVLLLIFALSAGARSIAGDEQAGTLELIAAHPVSRTRLALQRFAGLVATVVIICTALWFVMLALRSPAEFTEISVGAFVAMHIQLVLFASLFAALGFAVGGATGSRATALGAGAAFGVVGYLANGLLPQVDSLSWVDRLSPFYWLVDGDPLRNGIQVEHVATMVILTAALLAVGTWAFDRRDLAV